MGELEEWTTKVKYLTILKIWINLH
jgi:hypothetical protein